MLTGRKAVSHTRRGVVEPSPACMSWAFIDLPVRPGNKTCSRYSATNSTAQACSKKKKNPTAQALLPSRALVSC